jgi:hypothetical protein
VPVTLLDEQNRPTEVDEADLPTAIASGKYAHPGGADAPVEVTIGGQRGTVPISKLTEAVKKHGAVVTPRAVLDNEARARAERQVAEEREAKYNTLGGKAASAAGGALETATFGLGNYALPDSAKEYLRGAEEVNPGWNKVGQAAGLIAPIAADVLTGGLATPEIASAEGATLAGTAARAGARAIAAPMRAVGAIGDVSGGLTEAAVRKLVGGEATSVAGKLAEKAVVQAGRGVGEGALMGVAQTAGDEQLQEHPNLTAEKLMMGGLLGGALGGFGGGVLGFGGEAGSRFLGPIARRLDRGAEEQAARSLFASSDKRGMREIMRLASDEAGADLGENGVNVAGRHALDRIGLQAGDTVDSILPKAQAAVAEDGAKVGAIRQQADESISGPRFDRIYKDLTDRLKKFREAPKLNGPAISAIEGMLDDLGQRAGLPAGALTRAGEEAVGRAPTIDEARAFLQTPEGQGVLRQHVGNQEFLNELGKGKVPLPLEQAMGQVEVRPADVTRALQDARISYQDLAAFRSQHIDPKINFETVAGKESQGAAALKSVRGAVEDEIERAMGEGDPKLLEAYKDAKTQYARSKVVTKIVERSVTTRASNALLSPTDKGVGLATAAGMLAGHLSPLAFAAGIGSSMGARLIRERGNATAAVVLDKLASLHALQRASEQADRSLNSIARATIEGGNAYAHTHRAPQLEGYAAKRDIVLSAAQDPRVLTQSMQDVASPFATNHPTIAAAYATKATGAVSYLASQVPQAEHPNPYSLTPQLDKQHVPDDEKDRFDRKFDAVYNPLGSLSKLQDGTMTQDERDAIQATHPEFYAQSCDTLRERLKTATKPLPYQVEQTVRMYLGAPAASPQLVGAMTAIEAASAQKAQAQGAGPKGGKGGKGKSAKALKTDFTKSMGLGEH